MDLRVLATCVAVYLFAVISAQAEPATKYTYYLINGNSANSLYNSMLHGGPSVNGNQAYAAAKVKLNPSALFAPGGRQCRVRDLDLGMSFVISLPKLNETAKLDQAVRRSFNEFYAFAKRHEETHRSIWLKCEAIAEARINAVKAGTCEQAESKARQILDEVANTCNRRHVAFDVAQQKLLPKLSFIKLVASTAP
jgi:predicted secreted Zn-dependent protease